MTELPDIKSITYQDRIDLPENITDALSLKYASITGLNSLEAVKNRVFEVIHWNTLCAQPVTAAYLNRLLGRVTYRHGTSIIDVTTELLLSGKVKLFDSRAKRISYVSAVPWAEVLAKWNYMTQLSGGLDVISESMVRWTENIR